MALKCIVLFDLDKPNHFKNVGNWPLKWLAQAIGGHFLRGSAKPSTGL
jgi:hypothetical protein